MVYDIFVYINIHYWAWFVCINLYFRIIKKTSWLSLYWCNLVRWYMSL